MSATPLAGNEERGTRHGEAELGPMDDRDPQNPYRDCDALDRPRTASADVKLAIARTHAVLAEAAELLETARRIGQPRIASPRSEADDD